MKSGYKNLGMVILINIVVMFVLTYALIADFSHFYPNLNRFYMALLMAAPMVVLMIAAMGAMYPNKRLNTLLISAFSILFLLIFFLARTQTPIREEQFLRSMIPHHSSAILMCEQADINDKEIVSLCVDIVQAQEREIAQMKAILERY